MNDEKDARRNKGLVVRSAEGSRLGRHLLTIPTPARRLAALRWLLARAK